VFRFCAAVWLLAGLLAFALMALYFSWLEALAFAAFVVVIAAGLLVWAQRYRPDEVLANFRRVMAFSYVTAGGFLVYIIVRMVLS
jgi:hypothetical protein